MALEENKAVVRKWIAAWARGDLAAMDELFAPGYTVNGVHVGPEGVKGAVQFLHTALGDVEATLDDLVAEGDKVAIRWTVRGTHRGDFMGVAPTGQTLELKGINIYQLAAGKIVANHEQTNVPALVQRLKAAP